MPLFWFHCCTLSAQLLPTNGAMKNNYTHVPQLPHTLYVCFHHSLPDCWNWRTLLIPLSNSTASSHMKHKDLATWKCWVTPRESHNHHSFHTETQQSVQASCCLKQWNIFQISWGWDAERRKHKTKQNKQSSRMHSGREVSSHDVITHSVKVTELANQLF